MRKTLDELQALTSKPSVLASPKLGGTLLFYITATTQIINTTLVVER
jgi:hypothetical protein